MFLKLLPFLFLVITSNAIAQKTGYIPGAPVKAGEIDYKLIGAPMPAIRMILYQDSLANIKYADSVRNDSLVNAQQPPGPAKKKTKEYGRKEETRTVLTNADVDNGANLFIMLFNPTCSHCEDETAMLEKNISLFRKSGFLLMATPPMKPYLPDFVSLLHVKEYPVFSIGVDSSDYMNDVFLYHAGEVEIDSLKKYIQ